MTLIYEKQKYHDLRIKNAENAIKTILSILSIEKLYLPDKKELLAHKKELLSV